MTSGDSELLMATIQALKEAGKGQAVVALSDGGRAIVRAVRTYVLVTVEPKEPTILNGQGDGRG